MIKTKKTTTKNMKDMASAFIAFAKEQQRLNEAKLDKILNYFKAAAKSD